MECSHAQSLLEIYLDQELDPVRNLEIEEHLHDCAGCAQSYGQSQVIRQSLKAESFYFKAPPELEKRVQRSLRQAAKAEAPARWFSGSWFRMAAPLAVAALVVLMIVPYFAGPSRDELLTQEVVASHIRSLMANHLADVPSTDQHTVKPWFNGKLDFSPPVSDLANQGFPLIGGRLDYLNNRPIAALIYRRDKHLINVFVWPASTGPQLAQSHKTQQGYNVIRWTSSAMNFWAVSDLDPNQLVKFSELLKSSIPSS